MMLSTLGGVARAGELDMVSNSKTGSIRRREISLAINNIETTLGWWTVKDGQNGRNPSMTFVHLSQHWLSVTLAWYFGRRVCPSSQNRKIKRHMIDFIMSLALLPNGNFT